VLTPPFAARPDPPGTPSSRRPPGAYSNVGGIGTTLVEAVHLGRRAIGVELEPRWAAISAADLCLAPGRNRPRPRHRGGAPRLGLGQLDNLRDSAQLILSSPPYVASLYGHVCKRADRVEKYDDHYSRNPDNLARLPRDPG
jgi:modification methylase